MKMRRLPVAVVASWLWVLAAAIPAAAGEIVGTARDSSGAVLPAARVAVRNNATGEERAGVTDGQGRFQFDGLSAGLYTVTVSFEGFSQDGRTVTLADADAKAELSFELQPGDLAVGVTVTATRAERDLLLVPLRADTLTRDQLDRASPASTGDALVRAPGIAPVGSGPFETRPRLRGLDSTRVLVLVDGERLNNARTATDRAGTEVGLADISTVSSLEVVGGSGSVLYGTDALAGTINIVTHDAVLSDRLHATYGFDGHFSSNENEGRGTARVGVSGRHFAVSVAGTLESFDDYRAGKAAAEDTRSLFASGVLKQADTIDDAFHFSFHAFPDPFNAPFVRTDNLIPASAGRANNLQATGLFSLTGTQTLEVKYTRRRMEHVGFADFDPPMFFQQVSLPFSNLDRASARYEARALTSWFTNLRVTAYYQDQDRLLRNQFPVQFPVPSPAFFPITVHRLDILSDTEQHVKTPGVDIQATMLARRSHVVTAGATIYGDLSRDQRTTVTQSTTIGKVALGPLGPQATVFDVPVLDGPSTTSHPVRVPGALFRDIGLFVQDEWEVNRFLRVVGGLRADSYRVTTDPTPGYDVASLIAGAQPAIDPAGLPDVGGDAISRAALTGEIGAVVRASDRVSVVARYGRSYRHPNLEELLFSGPATVGAIVPNLAVRPETGNNVDVGLKVRSTRYAGSLSYFNNTYHGFISTEIVAKTPSGDPLSQAVNFADVRIQGIEGDVEVPVALGSGTLTLLSGIAYLRGGVLRGSNLLTGLSLDGTPQDNITPFKATPGVRFSDSRNRFWIEYGARVESKVRRVATTRLDSPFLIAQDLLSLDGFTVQRLAWGLNVRQGSNRLGITFAVENLADRFYREQFQFAPARGRTFTIGVNLRGL